MENREKKKNRKKNGQVMINTLKNIETYKYYLDLIDSKKGDVMLENVSIILPFQTDNGPRAEAFEWILKYYAHVMPEAELCLGLFNGQEMNKSKAINEAAQRATRDIFVIADADVVYDPSILMESIHLLQEGAPWVVPFTELYEIPMGVIKKLLNSEPKWPLDVRLEDCQKLNWLYEGFAGKLIVIPRTNFEKVGGFDERFVGWGGEDDAFSHTVITLCGKLVNVEAKLFHVWHPPSNYNTNPHGEANKQLLNRYIAASGNKEEMEKIIQERRSHEMFETNIFSGINEIESMKSPKSKICFSILVHKDRELVKQLIDNVRYYCPNSAMVLYNGGDDPHLCDGLGVPVCPSSRKLERGFTTIYFLETMEWLEEMEVNYDYFINLDSDALFIRKGYEKFVQEQMQDTDYMAVSLRIPEEDWYIGIEMRKDIDRWRQLFCVDPLYGIFNVGQVINQSFVKALLEPQRKEKLTKALLETISFGTDEIVLVNMAKELGFRLKSYPRNTDSIMIRYRPYFTLDEMIDCFNNIEKSWLCHPVSLERDDLVRRLIKHLGSEHYSKQYQKEEYPWYKSDPSEYTPSLPIQSSFGNLEIVVRSDRSLTHYWENRESNSWVKSNEFARGIVGMPVFHENDSSENFEVACKLESGGVAFWWRDNHSIGHPWHGPTLITNEDVNPILLAQLQDGRHILICKSGDRLVYWVREYYNNWLKGVPLT